MNRIVKRLAAFLLSSAVFVGILPLSAAARTAHDITLDDTVNMMDVMALYRHTSGAAVLSDEALVEADVDNNGSINTADVMKLYQLVSGAVIEQEPARVTIREGVTDESVYMNNIVVNNTRTGRTFTAATKEDLQMAVAEIVRYEVGMSTFGEKNDEAWKAMAVAAYTVLARHCYNGASYNISMTKDIDLTDATDKRIYDAV
ncbi:MAG: dockerin type I repeat-containing protein, partial [Clostridia bacterium]|nr:dockerin type I repeat-containing protein [Clostridia bacterium]